MLPTAGEVTCFNVLTAISRLTGARMLDGEDITGLSPSGTLTKVSPVPFRSQLFDEYTTLENVLRAPRSAFSGLQLLPRRLFDEHRQ